MKRFAHTVTADLPPEPTRRVQQRLALFLGLACLVPAWAQVAQSPQAPQGLHYLEAYEEHNRLSAGFDRWRETGVRGIYQSGQHQLSAEALHTQRFNESGNYLGLGDTVVLNPEWYASLNVGAGDGAAYLPKYRIDGFIHRKFLDDLRLVGSLGLGLYRAPDGHQDDNVSLGLSYYFSQPWVVQAQVKSSHSNPGGIRTLQYFVAASWAVQPNTQITGRYGWGEEGYQSLGGSASITEFSSRQKTLTVQHRLGPDWGLRLSADNYHNPVYNRTGWRLALFKEFR